MTKTDLIDELNKISLLGDTEIAHSLADDLLIAYLKDEDISKAYESIKKWYA